jgi:hypothetical protein
VPIAVEPDITNDIPSLLLGRHFHGDIIRIPAFQGDLWI